MSKFKDDEKNSVTPKNEFEAFRIGGFADIRKMNIGYDKCKKYADQHGIKIYNATRGGKLGVFERVDFDSLFEVNTEGEHGTKDNQQI